MCIYLSLHVGRLSHTELHMRNKQNKQIYFKNVQAIKIHVCVKIWLPLWSSGQSSSVQIQRSQVLSLALPDFQTSSGPGTGFIQPREYNWGATWKKLENREYGRGDPLRWPHNTLCPQKLAITSPTSGGRSVGIVCMRAKATEFVCMCKNLQFINNVFSILGSQG
jgi:hypothetical protein